MSPAKRVRRDVAAEPVADRIAIVGIGTDGAARGPLPVVQLRRVGDEGIRGRSIAEGTAVA
ncbi:MAG: hypothetical protein CV090_04400 [Nitrospira sp. WS238]|nr:hypothetical protein [Nitrospira sp. WS238]